MFDVMARLLLLVVVVIPRPFEGGLGMRPPLGRPVHTEFMLA